MSLNLHLFYNLQHVSAACGPLLMVYLKYKNDTSMQHDAEI
jgi:hypothetical protein